MLYKNFSHKSFFSFSLYCLFFLSLAFALCSCSEEKKQEESEVSTQIAEYTKKLEDCKESVAEHKASEKKNQKKIEEKKTEIKEGYTPKEDDIILGNIDAKVTIIEYYSPTCPHCVGYHKHIFPEIKQRYIDTQKILYIVREFIGNKQDLDATILLRCLNDQNSYEKFKSVILSKQNSWAFSKNYREILTNIGALGGVTPEKYSACLNDQEKIQSLMENTRLVVKEPRFVGTPTFIINGELFTKPYSFDELSKAIDAILLEST